MISGHKPQTYPLGQNPLSVARPDQDITPCRIRTQCTMSFFLQERGFWKLNFRIGGYKPSDMSPFIFQVGDVWFCGFYPALPLNGGFCPGGLCPVTGMYDPVILTIRPPSEPLTWRCNAGVANFCGGDGCPRLTGRLDVCISGNTVGGKCTRGFEVRSASKNPRPYAPSGRNKSRRLWTHMRAPDISIDIFKNQLKAFLFTTVYWLRICGLGEFSALQMSLLLLLLL